MAKKFGTAQQEAAFNAGIGYGHGKANKRVEVQPENQAAFRDGVNAARNRLGRNQLKSSKSEFTREEKIKHYTKRIDDPKLSERQRSYAVRRLQELANS